VGALVSLGGDIATAGAAPPGGWRVQVRDRPGEPACAVTLAAGGALATSSTIGRRWRRDGRVLHHILDPRTCQPAPVAWRTVTVAARSCLAANTASTAALVRAELAVGWLRRTGLPARLVDAAGSVHAVAGWPPAPPALTPTSPASAPDRTSTTTPASASAKTAATADTALPVAALAARAWEGDAR
jgi:thiamine biosynthesis lipoprotein